MTPCAARYKRVHNADAKLIFSRKLGNRRALVPVTVSAVEHFNVGELCLGGSHAVNVAARFDAIRHILFSCSYFEVRGINTEPHMAAMPDLQTR